MKNPTRIVEKGLADLGFRKLFSTDLCLRIDDIALIVGFEKPGGLYAYYAIIPLFMPCHGYPYLTYGNRLCRMYPDCPALFDPSEDEIEFLCEAVIEHVKNDILHFAHALYSAKAICMYCESSFKLFGRWNMRYLPTPPDERARLFMYSSLYAREYEKAIKAARICIKEVNKEKNFMKVLIDRKTNEAETVIKLIEQKKFQDIDEIMKRNMDENLAMLRLSDNVDIAVKKRLLRLQAVDDCYGGPEVDSVVEEIIDEALMIQGESNQKKYIRNRIKEVFHVKKHSRMAWVREANWPMGKGSPMQYVSTKHKGDEDFYLFKDADTGEKRIITQSWW